MHYTLWYSLHLIFGTWKGIGALTACITVIWLFALAFSNYVPGEQGKDDE